MLDHCQQEVTHGRARLNGVKLHYVTAGAGEPLLLLHGVPKSAHYWHRLLPLLSERYTVIAPDLRGFGDSEKPADGYDIRTVAADLDGLLDHLGLDQVYVHGEDWGAAFGYGLAAYHPHRVKALVYADMLLPGFGLAENSYYTPENLASGHWVWHLNLFALRDYAEMLITGRERAFWSAFMRDECVNPDAISDADIDIFLRGATSPGGLRAILSIYRETFANAEANRRNAKLDMPVLGIGATHWLGAKIKTIVADIANDSRYTEMDCGHSLALEKPDELARVLTDFFQTAGSPNIERTNHRRH